MLIGVTVDAGGLRGNRLEDRGVRWPRALVRGQLHDIVRLVCDPSIGHVHAGLVMRHAGELVGERHGHRIHCSDRGY